MAKIKDVCEEMFRQCFGDKYDAARTTDDSHVSERAVDIKGTFIERCQRYMMEDNCSINVYRSNKYEQLLLDGDEVYPVDAWDRPLYHSVKSIISALFEHDGRQMVCDDFRNYIRFEDEAVSVEDVLNSVLSPEVPIVVGSSAWLAAKKIPIIVDAIMGSGGSKLPLLGRLASAPVAAALSILLFASPVVADDLPCSYIENPESRIKCDAAKLAYNVVAECN